MRKRLDIELSEATVADRLLKLRMREGLTQEELCEKIGYTSNYYGQAERGAISLSRKLAYKLRVFYHTTYDYLYDGIRNDRVFEDAGYERHPIYEILEGCNDEERDILYQIIKPVIRNIRDYKTGEPSQADAGKAKEKKKEKNR